MKRYEHIAISNEIFESATQTIEQLEQNIKKNGLPIISSKEKTHTKIKFVNGKLTQQVNKLTIKMFAESALNYFIKYKIDPRFYDDSENVAHQVVRLRNQIFSFLQVQERQHIMPINAVLAELKQKELDKLADKNQHFSPQIFAYLVSFSMIFFDTLDMEKEEIERIKTKFNLFYDEAFKQLENQ